jgi:hypothetical protein
MDENDRKIMPPVVPWPEGIPIVDIGEPAVGPR